MNFFQLIKTVLDELYEQIPAEDEPSRDKLIQDELNALQWRYNHLDAVKAPLDYTAPATRFAYIYRYTTSHAGIVHQLLSISPYLGPIFDKKRVTVTSIGGGPGSDLLGILKYMISEEKHVDLSCLLYDREQAWGESWSDIDQKVDLPFRLSTVFQAFDVTEPTTWSNAQKYLRADLFTLIYFLSEIHSFRYEAEDFFANLFQRAKQGALFLYVDNKMPKFYDWFDELATEHGLEVLSQNSTNITLPSDEEKSDLGGYFSKFEHPKLTARIAYRICRKV
jgi:hypothetical protein